MKDNKREEATILFIDVMNTSEISNILTMEEYDSFLDQFQRIGKEVIFTYIKQKYSLSERKYIETSIRGDELCMIFYSGRGKEGVEKKKAIIKDIEAALEIAIEIKRSWLNCKFNKKRVLDGKMVEDIGIGINTGEVIVKRRFEEEQERAEGYAINLAKRIEGYSREGKYSKIMVAHTTYQYYHETKEIRDVFFGDRKMVYLKGISQSVPIYEVKEFRMGGKIYDILSKAQKDKSIIEIYEKIFENNPHDFWMGSILGMIYYLSKEYSKIIEINKKMIEIDPSYALGYFHLGIAYEKQGIKDKSKKYLEKYLKYATDTPFEKERIEKAQKLLQELSN